MSKAKPFSPEVMEQIRTMDTFMVIGPGTWGRAKDLKTARANCAKQGSKADKMIAYVGTEDIKLNDGCIEANGFLRLGEI